MQTNEKLFELPKERGSRMMSEDGGIKYYMNGVKGNPVKPIVFTCNGTGHNFVEKAPIWHVNKIEYRDYHIATGDVVGLGMLDKNQVKEISQNLLSALLLRNYTLADNWLMQRWFNFQSLIADILHPYTRHFQRGWYQEMPSIFDVYELAKSENQLKFVGEYQTSNATLTIDAKVEEFASANDDIDYFRFVWQQRTAETIALWYLDDCRIESAIVKAIESHWGNNQNASLF